MSDSTHQAMLDLQDALNALPETDYWRGYEIGKHDAFEETHRDLSKENDEWQNGYNKGWTANCDGIRIALLENGSYFLWFRQEVLNLMPEDKRWGKLYKALNLFKKIDDHHWLLLKDGLSPTLKDLLDKF